jgi:hypothetical protein
VSQPQRLPVADIVALRVAERLRDHACPHGLPERVRSADPVQPWGEDATCKPLCDACVMEAVRAVLRGD